MADGAFWNQPHPVEDWDRPVGVLTESVVPERELSASEWLGLQHKRGFPANPG